MIFLLDTPTEADPVPADRRKACAGPHWRRAGSRDGSLRRRQPTPDWVSCNVAMAEKSITGILQLPAFPIRVSRRPRAQSTPQPISTAHRAAPRWRRRNHP